MQNNKLEGSEQISEISESFKDTPNKASFIENSKSFKEENLTLPSAFYYADPYAAVRSILGNDVSIISLKVLDIILPDECIVVYVKYSSIDFDSFKLYKVLNTKILSQQSNKCVATELQDTITGEIIKDKLVLLRMESHKKEFYITIKYFQNINSASDIVYYGTEVNPENFKSSFISIFDSRYLSYHGSLLQPPKIEKAKGSDLDATAETEAFYNLIKVKNNNFTNACFDASYIHKYYVSTLQALPIFKVSDAKGISEDCILDLEGDISNLDKLIGMNAVLIISGSRKNILSCILIHSISDILTKNAIDNAKIVLSYDVYNANLLNNLKMF